MYEENYGKRRAYYERRKKRRRKIIARRFLCTVLVAACIVGTGIGIKRLFTRSGGTAAFPTAKKTTAAGKLQKIEIPDFVDPQLIHVHTTARTGIQLEDIKDIVIHYVGNPGTTAKANRNYFESLSSGETETYASSHFIVGLEGEVIQCIPLTEIAYASNIRNEDTVAIEVCHPDETGAFSPAAYQQVVELTAWLCRTFDLDPDTDVIRHYDVTEKLCPLYYVEHPDAWDAFRADVAAEMERQAEVS